MFHARDIIKLSPDKKIRDVKVPCLQSLEQLLEQYSHLHINTNVPNTLKKQRYSRRNDETPDLIVKRRSPGITDSGRKPKQRNKKDNEPPPIVSQNKKRTRALSKELRRMENLQLQSKPGTLTSKQTLFTRSRDTRSQTKSKYEIDQATLDKLDTKNMVDDTLVIYLPEFCRRAKIYEPPKDAQLLCKPFSINLSDLGLDRTT